MSPLERFSKWIQLKIYQIEVSYSIYIFTPAEKFVFYSLAFLLFSLTFIALFLYLPHHVSFLVQRAWFYVHGDALEASHQHVLASLSAAGKGALPTALARVAAAMAREEL